MSIPKCEQMFNHRLIKMKDGKLGTLQKLSYQHYLLWMDGKAVTEVMCLPPDSKRWYWRGSLMSNYTKTLGAALMQGRIRDFKGVRYDGSQLQSWSELAKAAFTNNK